MGPSDFPLLGRGLLHVPLKHKASTVHLHRCLKNIRLQLLFGYTHSLRNIIRVQKLFLTLNEFSSLLNISRLSRILCLYPWFYLSLDRKWCFTSIPAKLTLQSF